MAKRVLGEESDRVLEQVLGYLNFSSGTPDPQLLANFNRLYALIEAGSKDDPQPPWRVALSLLNERLCMLAGSSPAFADVSQAQAVLELLEKHVLPGYLEFHCDLLFHQTDRTLFGPFFVGRVCEAVLAQGGPWDETERITKGAVAQLDDYIGHRPVATLESQRHEPYAHEWVRPIPLYVRGAGVAIGPHQPVVEAALELLEQTDEDLLRAACFEPELLDELAVDPRAYDFDHPVNKRPNYHFGQWDPHHIDNKGRYRRFVVQQVTLDALMERLENPGKLPREEVVFEAAAVLAGTMLMASGVSGSGPETHDSNVTLANLLPGIAAYRDAFYERLFNRAEGKHAQRLRKEARARRQPFGGARQHLNAQLARRRASQLEHVQLAKIYARMGYPEAAMQQADVVPTASARMLCRIDCMLVEGRRAVEAGELDRAEAMLPKVVGLLHRAIECGAVVDPWNILGFDAHFSLFPALENSVHDHRVDDLVAIIEQVFAFYARIWSEAAARDEVSLCERVSQHFRETAIWWRQFAAHEVSTIEASDAEDLFRAAEHVVRSLSLWHKGGAAAGDVAFWAPHAAMFDSPKAYALVIEALLDRGDFVASMALLSHWIGQAERISLEQGESSFHLLAVRWLIDLRRSRREMQTADEAVPEAKPDVAAQTWNLVRRYLDHLEANAEELWRAPEFELRGETHGDEAADLFNDVEEEDEQDELFGAAYEDMVFRDSTDDGVEGEIFEPGGGAASDDELERESRRISDRLALLETVARLWSLAVLDGPQLAEAAAHGSTEHSEAGRSEAARSAGEHGGPAQKSQEHGSPADDGLSHWIGQSTANLRDLDELLEAVERHHIPLPSADHDSLLEYDRRRLFKESLLERIIATRVETADAQRLLRAVATGGHGEHDEHCDAGGADAGTAGPGEAVAGAANAGDANVGDVNSGDVHAGDANAGDAGEGDAGADDAKTETAGSGKQNVGGEVELDDEREAVAVFSALLRRDAEGVRRRWPALLEALARKPLLYVPLAKGGNPRQVVAARVRQRSIQDLLCWMPRLGLLTETCRLIETAREMERNNPVGPGAVTEFDELFKMGYTSLVETLVASAESWQAAPDEEPRQADVLLVEALEKLTESLLISWLAHSRTLRLSVLEKVKDRAAWRKLVTFIQKYGGDLFTQRFFGLGNVRAILHQGVDTWLLQLEEVPDPPRLLEDLDVEIPREEAVEHLSLVLEAVIENYSEYRDYNSTTTQSDRGEMLYTLLDFLRLRTAYERVAWQLKPVIWAHEILVRNRQQDAAELWRTSLAERFGDEADKYLRRLTELQKKYAMRMPTVADRLAERFVGPMNIDRLCALVVPALCEADEPPPHPHFELLLEETEELTEEPTGVGLDMPAWLMALTEEVDQARQPPCEQEPDFPATLVEPARLSMDEVDRQVDEWGTQRRSLSSPSRFLTSDSDTDNG